MWEQMRSGIIIMDERKSPRRGVRERGTKPGKAAADVGAKTEDSIIGTNERPLLTSSTETPLQQTPGLG